MLDPSYIRDHMEEVRTGLRNRGLNPDKTLEEIATLETARRRLIPEIEGLKRQQNASGDDFARAKRQGKDTTQIQDRNKQPAVQIKHMGVQLDSIENQRSPAVPNLPNLPHPRVPLRQAPPHTLQTRPHATAPAF